MGCGCGAGFELCSLYILEYMNIMNIDSGFLLWDVISHDVVEEGGKGALPLNFSQQRHVKGNK